jgi:hypothetical protein
MPITIANQEAPIGATIVDCGSTTPKIGAVDVLSIPAAAPSAIQGVFHQRQNSITANTWVKIINAKSDRMKTIIFAQNVTYCMISCDGTSPGVFGFISATGVHVQDFYAGDIWVYTDAAIFAAFEVALT